MKRWQALTVTGHQLQSNAATPASDCCRSSAIQYYYYGPRSTICRWTQVVDDVFFSSSVESVTVVCDGGSMTECFHLVLVCSTVVRLGSESEFQSYGSTGCGWSLVAVSSMVLFKTRVFPSFDE